MALPPLTSSGVVGVAGRIDEPVDVRTADLRLAGGPLPVTSPARVYVCGITPYDVTHLGHAATFVWADVLGAVLRLAGAEVVSSRNVTDVDDVLTRAADARGRHYDEFALSQEFAFEQDMRALGVRPPTFAPRARHHIPHVQQLAAALLRVDRAYVRDGHVFFRAGDLVERSGLDADRARELAAEFGDEPDDDLREDPFDVPVWRPSGDRDPAWPSPWGWGRPGWHAECAAMATASLGHGVDVLVGGADLAFPHHAHQAAMAEAASGVGPFARAQVHVGAVSQDGAKMAKSTGNLTLVADLLKQTTGPALRLLVLDRPWSQPWEFRPGLVEAATARLDALFAAAGRRASSTAAAHEVTDRLLDDLDVPGALDVAVAEGGDAARLLVRVLALG
ncbi:class I tRNA ligase family protein [Geodermatophilus sabuli]|uniref:Class I tRNA ligase family protein n=1 Tax=Geodermatophilus sabuli TaxID=1564158 RepID=A0A7K3W356_9ACTN|nr:class I tRNA ligase family protein [Geodermatophilus sabuli]NEK58614.1 class I tRNA ligase family protein [Geodermatophilus sabuli]